MKIKNENSYPNGVVFVDLSSSKNENMKNIIKNFNNHHINNK